MLRLVKWAHDLGVKQERERIARALERVMESNRDYIGTGLDMLNDRDSTMSKTSKKKLDYQIAVRTEVNQIVQSILEPRYEPSVSASVMFPDGPEKQ